MLSLAIPIWVGRFPQIDQNVSSLMKEWFFIRRSILHEQASHLGFEEVDGDAVVLQTVDSHFATAGRRQRFFGDELQQANQSDSSLQLSVDVSQPQILLKNTRMSTRSQIIYGSSFSPDWLRHFALRRSGLLPKHDHFPAKEADKPQMLFNVTPPQKELLAYGQENDFPGVLSSKPHAQVLPMYCLRCTIIMSFFQPQHCQSSLFSSRL